MDEVLLDDAHRRAVLYLASAFDRRAFPDDMALAGLAAFDEPLSEVPRDALSTIALLDQAGGPATVASAGGRYFGFVTGGSLPVATAADWLVTAWDQNAAMPVGSPVAARIEAVAGRWVRDILRLPSDAATAFVTGASIANLSALAAARHRLLARAGWDVEAKGLAGAPPLRIVAGADLHSTLPKLIALLGLGRDAIELVETDDQGRVRPEKLPPLDARTILCLQAGNVNSGASDPFPALIPSSKAAGAWVHVDGAFGLWAAASPRYRHLVEGAQSADSWATDAHKWLNVPYDCGILAVRDADALRGAMQVGAAYMLGGAEMPAKDLAPEFSRRARGITVWAALRTLGRSGVAELVERCCAHARRLEAGLRKIGFTIHNEVVLNQIIASLEDPAATEAVRLQIEACGEAWFGPTEWCGRPAVRLSVSSWATTNEDVDRTLAAIASAVGNVIRVRPTTDV